MHVTLFDRGLSAVNVQGLRPLSVDDDVMIGAAEHLGLA